MLRNFSHDEIANILKVPARSFEETYPEKSKEFKRALVEYIETIRSANADLGADGAVGEKKKVAIELDSERFPIAPVINVEKKMTKDDLEPLYRLYMTQHYRESAKLLISFFF